MDDKLWRTKKQYQRWKYAVPALTWCGDRRAGGGTCGHGATNADNANATELGDVAQGSVDVIDGTEGGRKNIAVDVNMANVKQDESALDGMGYMRERPNRRIRYQHAQTKQGCRCNRKARCSTCMERRLERWKRIGSIVW